MMEFTFEPTPWERYLSARQKGDRIPAQQLLALLEEEEESALEDALNDLETACMELDVSGLPDLSGGDESALRLRRERELANKPILAEDFEENDPLRLYLEEIAGTPVWGDEDLLIASCLRGDETARQRLTELGLSRVVEIAREYTGHGVLLLDLIQEGSLGLWQAVCSCGPEGYPAHRDRWIRLYMARAVTLQARASGVGRKLRTALEDYRSVDEQLLAQLGRNPTLEEIAGQMHISLEEAENIRKMLDDARLLARAKAPEEETPEEEEDQAVEDTALFRMRQRILDLMSQLNEADRQLLNLRFGLEGGKPLTPEEAGKRLGLTREEVVAREAAALAKLRNAPQ